MLAKLHYGRLQTIEINVADDSLLAYLGDPQQSPIDVPAALAEALSAPLDFPPLAQAVVPGDKVALAITHDVPQTPAIVAELTKVLTAVGIDPRDITVVVEPTGETHGPSIDSAVKPLAANGLPRYELHDPENRQQLAYLAADPKAKPIYINRTLDEADFVVPITSARIPAAFGYAGASTGLFPTFSDQTRSRRLHSPRLLHSAQLRRKLQATADQVSWLLGVTFAVQVVPGIGESVLQVVAGRAEKVYQRAEQLCRQSWSQTSPELADVVVAAVGCPSTGSGWDEVGRALSAARNIVEPDGAIVLLTDVASLPGPGVQSLLNCDDLDAACHQLAEERPADALVATALAQALQYCRVYLLSQLEPSTVEDLGIARVENDQQLERLLSQYHRCVLIDNAQHTVCSVE
jgi:nickel-dependent lactate racemase